MGKTLALESDNFDNFLKYRPKQPWRQLGKNERAHTASGMRLTLEVPLRVVSLRSLAVDAFTLAYEIGLSAYDATYVLLTEATGSTLVTADRRLATAVERAALIPDDGPPTQSRH